MAVIIPFADAQAHGSIANSVTFRRYKGKVVFQKKPHARIPGTSGQKLQREKFKDAWKAYHALDFWALEYVKAKAAEAQQYPANWFISQYLTDEIPSATVQYGIKDITDLDLPDIVGAVDLQAKFTLKARTDPATDVDLGNIHDKQNTFVDGAVAAPYDRAVLHIEQIAGGGTVFPFNYPLLLWWKNFSDEAKHNLIRLPAMTLGVPPSTDPLNTIQRVEYITIFPPEIPFGVNVSISFWWEYVDPWVKYLAGSLQYTIGRHPVKYGWWPNDPSNFLIRLTNNLPDTFIMPDNTVIHFEANWKDMGIVEFDIIFPEVIMAGPGTIYFWVADDFSLWYDRAMTSLAKSATPFIREFFIANDFSIYYNKEMTQLANAPYF